MKSIDVGSYIDDCSAHKVQVNDSLFSFTYKYQSHNQLNICFIKLMIQRNERPIFDLCVLLQGIEWTNIEYFNNAVICDLIENVS